MSNSSINFEWKSLIFLCLLIFFILLSMNIVVVVLLDINYVFKGIEGLGSWILLLYLVIVVSFFIVVGELGDWVGFCCVYG